MGLKNPESVLGAEMARLRHAELSSEKLGRIQQEFDAFAESGHVRCADIVQIMAAVDLCPDEADVSNLMEQMGSSHDTRVSFTEMIDIIRMLTE